MILDLETLGKTPGSVILSIAAIFDDGTEFERIIDIQSCLDAGLVIDTETLYWWMKQKRIAQFAGTEKNPPSRLLDALIAFRSECRDHGCGKVWVRGPDFDIPILEHAIRAVHGLLGFIPDDEQCKLPWKYNQVRDVRTAEDLCPHPFAYKGKSHVAIQDCRDDLEIVQRFEAMCLGVPASAAR